MAACLEKIRKTDPQPPSPEPVAKSSAVVIVGAQPFWKIAFSGRDCNGTENFGCTKPFGHPGSHNGVCISGKKGHCSTIYPHNPAEVHAWLSMLVVVGSVNRRTILSPADLKQKTFDDMPCDTQAFLRQIHDFIFGDGSPMSRLWLNTVASGSKVGPRTRIVSALNDCFAHTQDTSPLAALNKLIRDCRALPWPAVDS